MTRKRMNLRESLAASASSVRGPVDRAFRPVSPARRRLARGRTSSDSPLGDVPGARSPKLARVEAVLFTAGEPMSARRIADGANLADAAEARVLVQQLQAYYDAEGCAFTVRSIAGGWQLCTRPEHAKWLDKLHPSRQPSRLSQPALETLAVVAYRQPILRADIESIRGVSCGEMLRQLIDRGLIRIVGHHDSLGRPLLYGTTRKFLEIFGLADLSNLPLAAQLRQAAHAKQ